MRQGDLSQQEAESLFVRWYPLVKTEEELEQEDDKMLNLDQEDIDDDENRPLAWKEAES